MLVSSAEKGIDALPVAIFRVSVEKMLSARNTGCPDSAKMSVFFLATFIQERSPV